MLSDLVGRAKAYLNYKYHDRSIQRRGRRDGKLEPPVPPFDSLTQPPAIWELAQAANVLLQIIAVQWANKDKSLQAAWLTAHIRSQQAPKIVTKAQTTLEAAEQRYEAIHQQKPPATDRRHTRYGLGIGALGIAEVAFNEIVFRLVGESEVATLIFSLSLSGGIIGCAHFLASALHKRHRLWIGTLVATVLGVLGSIAWFRGAYLAGLHPGSGHIDATPAAVAFFFFNALLFVFATVYAYYLHNEDIAQVFAHRSALQKAERNRDAADKRLSYCQAKREKWFDHCVSEANKTAKNFRRATEAYRTENLAHRSDRQKDRYPASFNRYPRLDFPTLLCQQWWEAPDRFETTQEGMYFDEA